MSAPIPTQYVYVDPRHAQAARELMAAWEREERETEARRVIDLREKLTRPNRRAAVASALPIILHHDPATARRGVEWGGQ